MEWYLMVWKKYGVLDGRACRKEYWVFLLFNWLILIFLSVPLSVGKAVGGVGAVGKGVGVLGAIIVILGSIYVLAIVIPSISVSVRRLHDSGKSGWLILLFAVVAIIPFIGFIGSLIFIIFMCLPSDPGANKYGPNPKDTFNYRNAAEQGDAAAQYNLGIMYDHGRGVPQDSTQAALWYRKAAEQGYAPAQSNLGAAYHEGQGVPQNYAQAVAWYRKAAEQGDATAQFNLGTAYFDGQGVSQDYVESCYWLILAELRKPEGLKADEVAKLKADAASHLAEAVLTQTLERSRKWFEEHNLVSVGGAEPIREASADTRSSWPSIVGWALIVIGLLGGMWHWAAERFDIVALPGALITMAFFIILGIGAIKRSWKFIGIGLGLVFFVPMLILLTIPTVGSLKKQANETSAIQSMRAITQAQVKYESTFPANGYACSLASLGGDPKSSTATPAAAQLLQSDLASGIKNGYIFTIGNCTKVTVNGTDHITGYKITAVPQTVGKTGNRGYCSDESSIIKADPAGGENCTQPIQ